MSEEVTHKKEFEGVRDPIILSVIYNRLFTINKNTVSQAVMPIDIQ